MPAVIRCSASYSVGRKEMKVQWRGPEIDASCSLGSIEIFQLGFVLWTPGHAPSAALASLPEKRK
jgi:hypothetical protein